MLTIYHNPRCSKSREGLELLGLQDKPFTVIKYFNEPFTKEELTGIIVKLGISPLDLVRQKEKAWIDNYKGTTLTDDEIIDALLTRPALIERPIVINDDKAVIARPADKIKEIL